MKEVGLVLLYVPMWLQRKDFGKQSDTVGKKNYFSNLYGNL